MLSALCCSAELREILVSPKESLFAAACIRCASTRRVKLNPLDLSASGSHYGFRLVVNLRQVEVLL